VIEWLGYGPHGPEGGTVDVGDDAGIAL